MNLPRVALALSLGILTACGSGKPFEARDPVPAGSLVAQGTLSGVNFKSVTGTAQVYRLTTTSEYVIRIENLSIIGTVSGMQIAGKSRGFPVYTAPLRSVTGTINYPTGIVNPTVWSGVTVTSASSMDLGTATLTSTP